MATSTYSPILIERATAAGGFLAVAPENCPYHLAVSAQTESEARSKFDAAIKKWEAILADPITTHEDVVLVD